MPNSIQWRRDVYGQYFLPLALLFAAIQNTLTTQVEDRFAHHSSHVQCVLLCRCPKLQVTDRADYLCNCFSPLLVRRSFHIVFSYIISAGNRIQFMDKTTLGAAAILGIRSGSVPCGTGCRLIVYRGTGKQPIWLPTSKLTNHYHASRDIFTRGHAQGTIGELSLSTLDMR